MTSGLATQRPKPTQWHGRLKHHSELQKLRDDGKTLKITGKGESTLETYVRFIIVPAVRDASDDAAADKKDSAVLRPDRGANALHS